MRFILSIFVIVLALAPIINAKADAFVATLDPHFCEQTQIRATAIYIDTTMMIDGDTTFFRILKDKLKASLAPGELVSVIAIDPTEGTASEVWHGCWQEWSREELQKRVKNAGYFSQDPARAQTAQQELFWKLFDSQAVGKIYLDRKRARADVERTVDKTPSKQIIRAIASDGGRFANSSVTIRAIVYSDMAEKSDLGSAFQELPATPPNYGEKTGAFFRKGVFYFYGVGGDIQNRGNFLDTSRAFWLRVVKSLHGSVGGYGTDLTTVNAKPVQCNELDIQVTRDREQLSGKLTLLTDLDGDLVDSWVGITGLGTATLTGTFKCDGQRCRLDAATSTGLTITAPSEAIILSGPKNNLSGNIGVKGTPQWWGVVGGPPGN